MHRRKFLRNSSMGTAGLLGASALASCRETSPEPLPPTEAKGPVAVCTWDFGNATARAWEVLQPGGQALDAVEAGVMVEEADPKNQTVGLGGRPDREGRVTLDACIMDAKGGCGSVMGLEGFVHPISVARKVMEETPHVILVGEGAGQFAEAQGFERQDLLTEASRLEWEAWKEEANYQPIINIENHDTIGMLALDAQGNLAGACTTSGLAYKMRGRVGDSPVIGAGLYVDNEVGAATATGLGEEVVRTVGSFLIVELMRQGMSPQEACEEGVRRILQRNQGREDFQIGFLALNKRGETGAYCIHPGFSYRRFDGSGHRNIPSESVLKS
ncbi:N(4)-(beta-N-acetylglucosaminyl)-L-asparaginase [Robiginitalea sp. M366]|uniref:isoaspartyl peptidase/L-asparaginase family protein n=1 Tax=Robiginitalea aestuariiviva TaxID=3036903 RepID=UPI00240E4664|nr:N(4)-(beta-N-acetylglucosaminyl)-L-asparaginase [Robiginitalea aestuariiviva]MDG1571041.1 N(4)-(beta-N-acetylglucosaminyl)-L-asparaginase [Robiginitalea aestuariiviva]